MVYLIDEDVKSRNPLRKAIKEGKEREIEAARQPAVCIAGEIINMMGQCLELMLELAESCPDEAVHYLGEASHLAMGAIRSSRVYIVNMADQCSDETYRFVTRRENEMSLEKFMELAKPFYNDELKAYADDEKLAAMIQTRISTFPEVNEKAAFVCGLPEYDTELFVNKKNKTTLEMAKDVLTAAIPVIKGIDSFDNDTLFAELKAFAEAKELKAGAVMWIIRIGVSGMSVTPGGATELMAVLGKEESVSRLEKSLAKLN